MLQGVADVLLPLDLPELVPGFGQLAVEAFMFFAAATLVFGRDGELVAEAGAGAAAFGAGHGLAVGFGTAHGGAAVEADVVGVGGHDGEK